MAGLKARKCKACHEPYTPSRPLQRACSPICALNLARQARENAERRELRERRKKVKRRADWLAEAQSAVNRYVRLRDAHLPCASCDKPATWEGQWHASHFRSVGAASAVRFHLWNIHKACSQCNHWQSGNIAEYEPRLRERIGDAKVGWLKTQNQRTQYTPAYLERLKSVFNRKANRLARRMELSKEIA